MKKKIKMNVRLRIDHYGNKCHYCGIGLTVSTFSIDHVIPISKGGTDVRENKVSCCRFCNTIKADMSLEEFRPIFFLKKGYKYFAFEPEAAEQKYYPEYARRENEDRSPEIVGRSVYQS